MKTTQIIRLALFISISLTFASCGVSRHAERNFYASYSQKLGVQFEGKEDKGLIKEVATWKGVPYKYGSATKRGTDCSGFVSQVYSAVYNKQLHRSSKDMVKDVRYISKRNLKTGDLIFFKIKSRKVSHVAIYLADNKFIHATTRKGVMVDDMDNKFYKKYYFRSGRVKM